MVKNIQILEKLDYLIRYKKTGSPEELAKKFKVSEKCIRTHINTLRQLGAPIYFDRKRKSYCYSIDGFFSFTFTITGMTEYKQNVVKLQY
jgi:predicted DNA-binding transcriptional regulator YafY